MVLNKTLNNKASDGTMAANQKNQRAHATNARPKPLGTLGLFKLLVLAGATIVASGLITQETFATEFMVQPVNSTNRPTDKKPRIRKSVNAQEERDSLESYYEANVGTIGDEYITLKDSPEYIESLPNGRESTVTHAEIEKIRLQQSENEELKRWEQYFVMRKRIMAPTMK